jgi:hypothetical protein
MPGCGEPWEDGEFRLLFERLSPVRSTVSVVPSDGWW